MEKCFHNMGIFFVYLSFFVQTRHLFIVFPIIYVITFEWSDRQLDNCKQIYAIYMNFHFFFLYFLEVIYDFIECFLSKLKGSCLDDRPFFLMLLFLEQNPCWCLFSDRKPDSGEVRQDQCWGRISVFVHNLAIL